MFVNCAEMCFCIRLNFGRFMRILFVFAVYMMLRLFSYNYMMLNIAASYWY